MKKFVLVIMLMAIGMIVSAQNWSSSVSVISPASGILWGAGTHDTISTGHITTDYVIRLKSDRPMDIQFQTYMQKISGTNTGNVVIVYGSNDGSTWNYIDSTMKLASDATATKYLNLDDFNYSYIKLTGRGRGVSGITKLNCWYSIREE